MCAGVFSKCALLSPICVHPVNVRLNRIMVSGVSPVSIKSWYVTPIFASVSADQRMRTISARSALRSRMG